MGHSHVQVSVFSILGRSQISVHSVGVAVVVSFEPAGVIVVPGVVGGGGAVVVSFVPVGVIVVPGVVGGGGAVVVPFVPAGMLAVPGVVGGGVAVVGPVVGSVGGVVPGVASGTDVVGPGMTVVAVVVGVGCISIVYKENIE